MSKTKAANPKIIVTERAAVMATAPRLSLRVRRRMEWRKVRGRFHSTCSVVCALRVQPGTKLTLRMSRLQGKWRSAPRDRPAPYPGP